MTKQTPTACAHTQRIADRAEGKPRTGIIDAGSTGGTIFIEAPAIALRGTGGDGR